MKKKELVEKLGEIKKINLALEDYGKPGSGTGSFFEKIEGMIGSFTRNLRANLDVELEKDETKDVRKRLSFCLKLAQAQAQHQRPDLESWNAIVTIITGILSKLN